MSQNTSKVIKRALARWAFYFFNWIFKILPYSVVKAISSPLIEIAIVIVKRMRKIAKESLTIAFGKEKTPQEIDEIVKKCFRNLGRSGIEMVYFCQHPAYITSKVSFAPGAQARLDEALAQGRGVVVVTAHFGNFPLMFLYLARLGYKTNAIIRPMRDEKIEVDFQATRTRLGLKTVHSYPREACVKQSLKVLRNNELLAIPLDQNFGTGGVFVDFFGQKAATATGPVVFALRTGAVILPMFIAREKDDQNVIFVDPYFELEKRSTDDLTIEHTVARITQIIEKYVREYPHEWGWMHRRWKSKPKGETES